MTEDDVALLLRTAVPIDDIDQLLTGPNQGFPVIWIDTSDRPDLNILSSQTPLKDGFSICTWFYESPGKHKMRIGLRIEMRQPVQFVIPLVFKVSDYIGQLETLARTGTLWIVPGPPPSHLAERMEMTAQDVINKVVRHAGQGLLITLQDHLIEELRGQLAEWKRVK